MYIYCSECGGRTAQTVEKVRFCSSCGHNLLGTVASSNPRVIIDNANFTPTPKVIPSLPQLKAKKSLRPKIKPVEPEDDDEEIEDDDDYEATGAVEAPELTANPFDFEIVRKSPVKIGEIAGSVKPESITPVKGKAVKVNMKKFREDFKRNAGTSRKS